MCISFTFFLKTVLTDKKYRKVCRSVYNPLLTFLKIFFGWVTFQNILNNIEAQASACDATLEASTF